MATQSSLCSDPELHSACVWGRGGRAGINQVRKLVANSAVHMHMRGFPPLSFITFTLLLYPEWVPRWTRCLPEIYAEHKNSDTNEFHSNIQASLVQTWGTSSHSPHLSIQFPLYPQIPEPSCCHINLFSLPRLFNNLLRICRTLTVCQVLCFKLGLW